MSEPLALHGGPKAVQIPYQEGWQQVTEAEIQAVLGLLRRNILSIGDGSGIIGEFERAFAEFCGTRYALAMNSGTATLHSAYFACGVGPGTEVIVPAYTWHATITPILHCAATPVFCEIDPRTLTADPADIERRITPRTKAIAVVHVWGMPARMDAITAIARRHGVRLIEDCSHAHGATYQGRPVGSWGDIGCFSLQGSKAVSGGEAGVATTNDPELFDRMLLLGHFGRIASGEKANTFVHLGDMSLGTKYRPHPLAIAIANEHLKRLPELNRLRRRNFELLREHLRDCPGLRPIEPYPEAVPAAFLEFKLHYEPQACGGLSREQFAEAVQAEGAPLSVDRYSNFNYTYGLLHLAPLFNTFDRTQLGGCFYDPTVNGGKPVERYRPGSLPVTEQVCQQLLGFPAFTDVPEEFVIQCAQAVRKVAAAAPTLQ
jgi:dTDP-4-amino-4,6-dideoxygalactose transaminase